jgi:hypothetical protein
VRGAPLALREAGFGMQWHEEKNPLYMPVVRNAMPRPDNDLPPYPGSNEWV